MIIFTNNFNYQLRNYKRKFIDEYYTLFFTAHLREKFVKNRGNETKLKLEHSTSKKFEMQFDFTFSNNKSEIHF